MASLKEHTAHISKRELAYWEQGADNPPEAGPSGRPQWLDLDVPGSRANEAGTAFWELLDIVAQSALSTGGFAKRVDMVELKAVYEAYMDLAYVGARYDQLEEYIEEAKRQYRLLHEGEVQKKVGVDDRVGGSQAPQGSP